MISRRFSRGTGQPGRQEYLTWSRVTLDTLAENFGGPVRVGAGEAEVGSGDGVGEDAGEDAEEGWAGGVPWGVCACRPGWGAAAVPHAVARQPTATASVAWMRITNRELLTCRHPAPDK
ncbi:hypothetical protein GCM10017600_06180 [Streptosporangium carneum]|uniref:Uncharacterized protein n=1 Tax=Streptosporangium carneum TaxID=47481 RepID=A0A9W6MB25_9ACTN|nr:hypothetical protein GCM10017600_06180 [Streptosporangium carneum]